MSVGTEGIQGNVQILRLGSCRVCEGILETGIQGKDQMGAREDGLRFHRDKCEELRREDVPQAVRFNAGLQDRRLG